MLRIRFSYYQDTNPIYNRVKLLRPIGRHPIWIGGSAKQYQDSTTRRQ